MTAISTGVVMEKRAEDAIIERHESNGPALPRAVREPGFREALMEHLARSKEGIREEDAS
jgi:hypothetical protein